ncbi:MAG: adenylate/guanylate cyclase domain-containing protein, partial [Leptospirales bacterium]
PDWIEDADRENIINSSIALNHRTGAFARAYKRRKLTYYPRLFTELADPTEQFVIETYRLKNFVICPLIVEDELIGFLNFTAYEDAGLTRQQLSWLSILSEQIAGVVRANNLMQAVKKEQERTENARREVQALAELSRQATQSPDLQAIIDTVQSFVFDRFEIENVTLFLPEEDGRLAIRYYRIPDEFLDSELREFLSELRVPVTSDGGTIALAYRRGKTVHPPRIKQDWLQKSKYDAAITEATRLRSFANVPLVAGGTIIGVLAINSRKPVVLKKDNIQLLQAMGDQVAGAVQSALQFEEVKAARQESDRLLSNVLPESVAEELKNEGQVTPLHYDNVSVLFTDFVGFTEASQKMTPDELVKELDGCFSQFDEVIRRNNMEKLKTIGDAYMCAGGLPRSNATHPIDACLTALEFRAFMSRMAEVKIALKHDYWRIRIGIHSGPVTAGVIGANKFAYDIWGDTVNTASRMESAGEGDQINVSQETYELVRDLFDFEYRGKVKAKGKGELDMYFLERIKPGLSVDPEGLVPNARFEALRADRQTANADQNPGLRDGETGVSVGAPLTGANRNGATPRTDRQGW